MKILLLADEEEKSLWDYFKKDKIAGIDLIISCGDLRADYLEFLVTMANRPLYFVRGNHDRHYDRHMPEGCTEIDGKLIDHKGLRILGLGGSMRYNDSPNMYTESEMEARIRKLVPKIRLMNGFDLLITHAPAAGYGDMDDIPHRGFDCFNDLMMKYHPLYMAHGHVHKNYGQEFVRERIHESGTKIINAYGSQVLEIEKGSYPEQGKTGSFLYDLYTQMANARKYR